MAENLGEMRNNEMRSGASSQKHPVVEPEEVLNRLPEDIQRHIVSSLPMQDAVRTSILSTKWRKMWYSLSRLIFDYHDFPNMEGKPERFAEFINQTIIRHDASDIETLVIRPYPCINNEWVAFAVEHNVQNLILYGIMKQDQKLPCRLFTCKSLVRLDLSVRNYVLKWPTTIFLPNLMLLSLRGVVFPDENLTLELSSSCPSLEYLTIMSCNLSHVKFLAISASITYLNVSGCRGISRCEIKLRTPYLEEFEYVHNVARDHDFANISPDFSAVVMFQEPIPIERSIVDLSRCAIKFYGELRNAARLVLDQRFIELLSQASDLLTKLKATSFYNLVYLKIYIWPIKKHLETLIILLSGCPNLCALTIVISKPEGHLSEMSKLLEHLINGPMLNHLEYIKIKQLYGSEGEMEILKFLLMNAHALIEMTIVPPKKRVELGGEKLLVISDERWMEICGKVLEFEKASKKAIISFP